MQCGTSWCYNYEWTVLMLMNVHLKQCESGCSLFQAAANLQNWRKISGRPMGLQPKTCISVHSFISPTNAQLICFKMLKFTLKYIINAPPCFGLTKPSSGSVQSVLR